jgi:SEC-C motif domain protein
VKAVRPSDSCPCGSARTYATCCGPLHAGAPAPDPLSLMRSRYSAFVLCNEAYLLSTWHPDKRPHSVSFTPNQKWLGLRIVDTRVTGETTGEVEFIARSKVSNASAVRLHERSRFVREGGRWFYVDGDDLAAQAGPRMH